MKVWEVVIEVGFVIAVIIGYIGASIMNTELVKGALVMCAGLPFIAPALIESYRMEKRYERE